METLKETACYGPRSEVKQDKICYQIWEYGVKTEKARRIEGQEQFST